MSAAFAGAIDLSALNRPATAAAAPSAAAGRPASNFVVDVTEASFGEVVQISAEVPVVFELQSSRSAGTEEMSTALATLADSAGGAWLLARVDVDVNPRVAQAFGVQAVPTVVAVAGGQPVDGFTGAQTAAQLETWVASMLDLLRPRMPAIAAAEEAAGVVDAETPEEETVDPRFLAAEELLDAGDFAGATATYQQILIAEPGNEAAAAALAQTELLARVAAAPADAVASADAAPDDVAAQALAADVQLADGDPDAAFGRLIATVARTAGDDRVAARQHLLSLFALFPVDDERVRTARRKLAAALY